MREPHAATDAESLHAHDAGYLQRVVCGELSPAEVRQLGLPWTPKMVERSRRPARATIEAFCAAQDDGIGVKLADGMHHAFRDHAEAYCGFNDSAVGALAMQAEGGVRRAAILVCDVHEGSGTASLLAHDPRVLTFSLHGAQNFPFRKEASDLNVELADGTGNAEYLDALNWAFIMRYRRHSPIS